MTKVKLQPQKRLLKRISNSNDIVEYFFQIPRIVAERNSVVQGVVLLFHGCNHDGIDWFELPEERRILYYFLFRGFAVVSVSSKNRSGSRCWDNRHSSERHSEDLDRIVETLPKLFQEMQVDWQKQTGSSHGSSFETLPLYGIGASSGGEFLSILLNSLIFRGVCIMISRGNNRAWKQLQEEAENKRPKIAFVYMPKDTSHAGEKQINQVVQTYLGGESPRPRIHVETFQCYALQVTPSLLVERIENLTIADATAIVQKLGEPPLSMIDMGQQGMIEGDDSTSMLLLQDPRRIWDAIEQMLRKEFQAGRLLIESMRELLNVAYASHELTSEHIDQVVKFLTSSN